MPKPWEWVCEECADGFEDSCSRPEHCAKSQEKKRDAAEALRDRLKEEGKI